MTLEILPLIDLLLLGLLRGDNECCEEASSTNYGPKASLMGFLFRKIGPNDLI